MKPRSAALEAVNVDVADVVLLYRVIVSDATN